jgi:hypothetical protein
VSSTTQGASSGIVLGIVAVLLAQQFGWIGLSTLLPAIEYLALGLVVGALLGAGIGFALGKHSASQPPPPVAPWTGPKADATPPPEVPPPSS